MTGWYRLWAERQSPPALTLAACVLTVLGSGVAADSDPVMLSMDWETHGSLRITNPTMGKAVIVDDCWMGGSETGGFDIPRPTGPTLFAVACRQSDGQARVHVLQGDDLNVLHSSEPSHSQYMRLLPQGLMIEQDEGIAIWEAPDNHFGTNSFRNANGLASGLPYRAGQVLWPRLDPAQFRVASDPLTPLRLGPSDDAPFFARLGGYLLIHLGNADEDGFWRIGDYLRLCIPDGGCGYAHHSAVAPVHYLDEDPIAADILTVALGPRDRELSCWTQGVADASDGAVRCYRVLDVLTLPDGDRDKDAGVVVIASGVEILPEGTVMRCAACQASVVIAFAPSAEPERVILSDTVLMGAWGEGPIVEELLLDIAGRGEPWRLNVAEVYNDRGSVNVRQHEFSPDSTGIQHRLIGTVLRERHVEDVQGVLRVEPLAD